MRLHFSSQDPGTRIVRNDGSPVTEEESALVGKRDAELDRLANEAAHRRDRVEFDRLRTERIRNFADDDFVNGVRDRLLGLSQITPVPLGDPEDGPAIETLDPGTEARTTHGG